MSWVSTFFGNQPTPYSTQLKGVATQAGQQAEAQTAQAQQFILPELTGQLPPALQAQVTMSTNDAVNAIKSKYAEFGLSDSTMSTESQNYARLDALVKSGQLEQIMAQTGLTIMGNATNNLSIKAGVYQNLAQDQLSHDATVAQTIGQFAQAIGSAIGAATGNPASMVKPVQSQQVAASWANPSSAAVPNYGSPWG